MTTVRVTGVRETQNALKRFSVLLLAKVVRNSLFVGGNFLRDKIGQDIADYSKTGRLKNSIRVINSKINTPRRKGKIGIFLTFNPGKSRKDPKGAYYYGWVDKGWNFRKVRKGPIIRQVQGKGTVKKNFDAHGATAARLILESINTKGQAIINQLRRGG